MKTILFVEDDLKLASHWQGLLEQAGHRVIHKCSVEAAIEVLQESTIDLIITDILLQSTVPNDAKEGGLELISYVALNISPLPPIIAISGAVGESAFVDRNFDRLDTIRTLRKPVTDQEFMAAVELSILDGTKHIKPVDQLGLLDRPDDYKIALDSANQQNNLVQLLKATQFDLQRTQYSLDHAPHGVYWVNEDGQFIYTNEWNCTLLGYSHQELLSMSVPDISLDVLNLKMFRQDLFSKITDEEIQKEARHLRKDGTTVHVELTLQRLKYNNETIICAFVRDISDRKAYEAKLLQAKAKAEESEQRFRSLANSASPLCWITELDSKCSWLNDRWLEYCGKSLEDQAGFGWLETVHPDDRNRVQRKYESAFRGQEEFVFDYRLRRRDGEYRWFTANATPRFDLNQTFVGYVGMSFDCHDTKLQFKQLEASQAELALSNSSRRAMLELLGASDGVWDWTIGTEDSEYTSGFRDLLGFKGGDLNALPNTLQAFDSRIHPEDHANFWLKLAESCENKNIFVHEYRVRNAHEDYIWVRTRGNASYDDNGKAVRFVGLTFDISDRKQTEIELASEREALAESNKDLSQFAHVASHDLQEPLRAIGGFLQLLERKYGDSLDEQGRGYIQKSVDGAARMHQLINDLLLYSRVSRAESTVADIQLNWVFGEILNDFDSLIERLGAVIEIGKMPTITGARPMMLQLFRNLIGNALKYHGEDVPKLQITATADKSFWAIRVSDNGIGIEPMHAERIFQLFSRLHDRESYSGTGIGLAICKRAAERLGGTVTLEPQSGPGSSFVVRLPRNDKV